MAPGIEIGKTDVEVNVKWTDLLLKLPEVACKGALAVFGVTDGGPSIVSAALETLSAVSIDEPNESKAFALLALSFALALEDLRPKIVDESQFNNIRDAFKAVREKAKSAIEEDAYYMEESFFSRPSSLPLYEGMRDAMVRGVASFRLGQKTDETELGAQLDAAFNKAVYEVMKGRVDYFRSLHDAINAPGNEAAQLEMNWESYRSQLVHEFEVKPVFGQEETKVSLSQLYVPLRSRWTEKREGDDERPDLGLTHLVDLHTEVGGWVDQAPQNRTIKLVCGGPGSGKSSFAKALASQLAIRADRRPIFIGLQHLAFEDKLEEEIRELLVDQFEYFSVDPLRKAYCDSNRPIILIFDGLDELARPGGKGADEVARDFTDKLQRLLERLNGNSEIRAMAIVTGRNPIIQALQSKTDGLEARDVLEVIGYAPIDKQRALFPESLSASSEDLAAQDQRPEWWSKYAGALGEIADTPQALKSEKLTDLTNEPLLCYLLAHSNYATTNWEEAAENYNRIYEALLGRVWERGWGGGQEGPVRALTDQHDFDILMETMALATWHAPGGENRVATAEGFDAALKVTRAGAAWERFQQDEGGDVTNLALTFYFKRPDHDSRGFEFTHKSFSEYLVARLLFRRAAEIASDVSRGTVGHDSLLSEWLKVAGPSHISEDMVPFIRNEARLRAANHLEIMKESLQSLFSTIIRDGMPAHKEPVNSWREAEGIQRNAEINLIACLNGTTRALFEVVTTADIIQFDWGSDPLGPAKFLRRLIDSNGSFVFGYAGISHTRFRPLDLSAFGQGPFMTSMFLAGAELTFSDFSRAIISYGFFSSARMSNADLALALGTYTQFDEADLAGADLSHGRFMSANFDQANLEAADLTDANLTNASFANANLSTADLTGADLEDANLTNANLSYANLTDAKLEDAHLMGATLNGAIVRNATMPPNWRKIVSYKADAKPTGRPKPRRRPKKS